MSLYVERFCDDIRSGHLSLDHPERFPQGLGGTFFQWFQRQFPNLEEFRRDLRPALRAILAAREPLRVEILRRLFDWEEEDLRDFAVPSALSSPSRTTLMSKPSSPSTNRLPTGWRMIQRPGRIS